MSLLLSDGVVNRVSVRFHFAPFNDDMGCINAEDVRVISRVGIGIGHCLLPSPSGALAYLVYRFVLHLQTLKAEGGE
jgi:hypothetical protein